MLKRKKEKFNLRKQKGWLAGNPVPTWKSIVRT